MRVLFCGDRNWKNPIPIRLKLVDLPPTTTVVNGGARGADTIAKEEAERLEMKVETYGAEWEKFGRSAGPRRNQIMLDTGIDLVVAFHANLTISRGTLDCIRRARRMGIEVQVVT